MTQELDVKAHDPIDRQLEGEPRFPLMARDARTEVLVTVYAYLRERKWDQAVAALQAGIERLKPEPPRPDKDKAHAIAARKVATEIALWRTYNMKGQTPRGRTGAPDEPPKAPEQSI